MRHDGQAAERQEETGEGGDDKQGGVQPRLQDQREDGSPYEGNVGAADGRLRPED